jgi:hypothetical protein
MSYDFFVFPAEAADDLSAATRLYESAPARGSLTPGGRVAAFLASVGAAGLEASGHDAGVQVHTSWDDPRAHLTVVAGLARPHDLSVLDVQLTALYDPRGAVDVPLVTEAGPCLPFLTRPVLHDVLAHLVERRYAWARIGALRVTYDGTAFLLDGAGSSGDIASAEKLLWSRVASADAEA